MMGNMNDKSIDQMISKTGYKLGLIFINSNNSFLLKLCSPTN